MTTDKLVVGVAGMPGAGKSVVTKIAKGYGYSIIVMGDIVREEAQKRDMTPTPENLGKIMLELRKTEGDNVIAKKRMPKIEKEKARKIIVDGVRSLSEINEFKAHYPTFTLIAIEASSEARFKRLYRRRRSDDPKSWENFQERDRRELSVGLGEAIAKAEYRIQNEGDLKTTKIQIKEALRKIEEKWMK
ncbi:MAG TPA: AAA family ATPase [Candidatus Bathyarchaeia archaeon]